MIFWRPARTQGGGALEIVTEGRFAEARLAHSIGWRKHGFCSPKQKIPALGDFLVKIFSALNDNLFGCFRQFIAKGAQAFLQVSQGLSPKALNRQEGLFALRQTLEGLPNVGDSGFG